MLAAVAYDGGRKELTMSKIRVNDATLHVYVAGEGKPILFVHGFPLDHTMWQSQLDEFAKTHRVIAPDLRGFGESSVTPGTVEMKDFANDLAAVLNALGVDEPVCICGLSMGGYVGWQFVRHHGSRVGSLIFCDTKATADTREAIEGRMRLANAVMEHGAQMAFDAMLPKLVAETTTKNRKDVVERLKSVIINTDPEAIAAALRGMAARPDSTSLLEKINVPTLVIVGEHDALTPPAEMRKMAESIRGAKFVEVPNVGHMAPMEDSATVNKAMREFLQT
jgi:pimeloyl-ACP methyl ester carboxylesterase